MHVVVVTPPAPVLSLDEMRAQLRELPEEEDLYAQGLAAAALAWIGGPGGWLGRSIGSQTLEARFERFDCSSGTS